MFVPFAIFVDFFFEASLALSKESCVIILGRVYKFLYPIVDSKEPAIEPDENGCKNPPYSGHHPIHASSSVAVPWIQDVSVTWTIGRIETCCASFVNGFRAMPICGGLA